MDARKRILFFAEPVTLAHMARPAVLAKSLDPARFDVHFAGADRYAACLEGLDCQRWVSESMASEDFLAALAAGRPIYTTEILERYLADDLAIIDAVKPDLIVGDFRLSLAVSAPKAGVQYANLTNAHWSPYAPWSRFPLPEHPMGRLLGPSLAEYLFNLVRPIVFRAHAAPLNRLRHRHSLPVFDDLRTTYTWGDWTLYADSPELIPTRGLPPTHRYIGPILWSPNVELPDWWADLPSDRPCVYVTLGSSGQLDVLPKVLDVLKELDVCVLFATAGRIPVSGLPSNVRAANFLPGSAAARRSALVICNGGSASAYQALAEGVPVIGICSNMDQHLTMRAVEHVGAGIRLRAERLSRSDLLARARIALRDEDLAKHARQVRDWFSLLPCGKTFPEFVDELSALS